MHRQLKIEDIGAIDAEKNKINKFTFLRIDLSVVDNYKYSRGMILRVNSKFV